MEQPTDLQTLIKAYRKACCTWRHIRSSYNNDDIDLKAAASVTAAWMVADRLSERIAELHGTQLNPFEDCLLENSIIQAN